MGLGFTSALTILGGFREILGNGTIFDFNLFGPDANMMILFILPPGAFLTYGYLIAIMNRIKSRYHI